MTWLHRTHGTRFELIRHFLTTMFDSEMFSVRHQWGTLAVSAFALTVPAGMILLESPSGRKLAVSISSAIAMAQTERLSSLTMMMSIAAILALLAWQSLFPSRRDYMALAALPVRSRQIFAARFGCVILLAAVITIMLILPVAGASPQSIKLATGDRWMPPSALAARTAATALGCLFTFFSLVGLQGLLINVVPSKWLSRCSGYVQGSLLAISVLAGLYSWFIPEWCAPDVPRILRAISWTPPVWFLGLHEKMSGAHDPFALAMAARAVRAAIGAATFALILYAAAGARFRRLLLEGGETLAQQRMRESRWLRWIARNPRQEAILQFLVAVLHRSRMHRLVIMGYGAVGLAIVVNAVMLGAPRELVKFIVLYWPVAFSFVVLAAVRHAFLMPAEHKANWLFRLTESQGRLDWMGAIERFVLVRIIAPLHLTSLLLAIPVIGAPLALRMTALQLLVSLAIFEFLFYSWQQLPFTCSYLPGKTSLILQLGAWMVVMTMLVPMLARLVATLAQMPAVFLVFCPIFVAVWLWARFRRRDGWGETPLLYEDTGAVVADLGIRELSRSGDCFLSPVPPATTDQDRPQRALACPTFHTLARAFPEEFRDRYGEEMDQVAAEAVGVIGKRRLIVDTFLCLCVEHTAQFTRDVRYSLRTLAASPGFTSAAVISLSLGICVATCAFSEMNGMVLRPLPGATRPEELVATERPASFLAYLGYRLRSDLFTDSAAYVPAVPFGVTLDKRSQRVWGQMVTPSYFGTFGVRPKVGTFDGLVISHRFWEEQLGASYGVIGQTLRINGHPVPIAGVTPQDFLGAMPMTPCDIWMPLPADPAILATLSAGALEHADLDVLTVVGRLRRGVTMGAAEAALDATARQFEQDTGNARRNLPGRRVRLVGGGNCLPLSTQEKPYFSGFLIIVAGLIMMIACANVANMMVARAASRRREIAVRLALGAGRKRIVRQLLTESLLVSGLASLIGATVSAWLMHGLGGMLMPTRIPVKYDFLQPDLTVLLFTIALSAFTALAFGLAPSLQATRADLTPALKEGGNLLVRRFRRLSMRNVLMVAQMASSLTVLVIVAYLSIGIQSKLSVQTGFDASNLYLVSLDPTRDGYTPEQSATFFPKLLERVQALPAVRSASLTVTIPVEMAIDRVQVSITGRNHVPTLRSTIRHIVGKDYFATAGIPILAGRTFRTQDETDSSNTVVVTEAFARQNWPGEESLGRSLEIANSDAVPTKMMPGSFDFRLSAHTRQPRVYEVIGVVGNLSEGLVAGRPKPAIYFPLRISEFREPSQLGVTLMVRAAPGVDAVALVNRAIAALDDNITPFYAGSMMRHIEEFMSMLRTASWTYATVGFFGLVLAAVGLAGMTAYAVASRKHEIGIRMALGAGRGRVLGLVMKEAAALIAIGLMFGMVGAWMGSRGLAAMSYEAGQVASTSATDPAVIFGSPLLLAAMALTACYIPARKASTLDPALVLRKE
jgi:predicted permease